MINEKNNPPVEKSRLDVEGRLRVYFPVFFELLGDNKLDWTTAAKALTRKVNQWKAKANGGTIRVEASFYNIITAAIEGNQQAATHLDFIKKVFEELIQRLDRDERRLIVPALYGLLTNIDRKFRNFLGELLVLNNMKRNTQFKLQNAEVPVVSSVPNGPRIDFQFLDVNKSSTLLVEVVNVHLTDIANWSDERVNNLLHQKIQHKLNITGIRKNPNFQLIPVFWGSFEELVRIDLFYRVSGISFRNTVEPTSFASFTRANGQKVHMFGTIRSIVDFYNSNQEA